VRDIGHERAETHVDAERAQLIERLSL